MEKQTKNEGGLVILGAVFMSLFILWALLENQHVDAQRATQGEAVLAPYYTMESGYPMQPVDLWPTEMISRMSKNRNLLKAARDKAWEERCVGRSRSERPEWIERPMGNNTDRAIIRFLGL